MSFSRSCGRCSRPDAAAPIFARRTECSADSRRMEALPTTGGELLVLPIFLEYHLLGLGKQPPCRIRMRSAEGAIAQLVERIVREGDRWPRRIEPERPLADRAHHGIEAKERPVPARDGETLLAHPVAEVESVRDAVAIGEDER